MVFRVSSELTSKRSTIESFLETQFQPARTILLAFGFDEESDGLNVSNIPSRACRVF